jgi:hypothetical protein
MKARSMSTVRCWVQGLAWALACVAGSANAAVYTGVWDPVYGAPFTNLGWRGTATYAVPDSCEISGSGDISNALDCGGAATVSSASVEFYDASTSGQGTLATLVFDPSSLIISTLRYLDGNLDQLVTTSSNAAYAGAGLSAMGVTPSVAFFLQFDLAGPHLAWLDCADETKYCLRGVNSFAPQFSISRVPEPGSLWLSGLALFVAVTAVRRRALRT